MGRQMEMYKGEISEFGACGAALFLFSPCLGVGAAEDGWAFYLGGAFAACFGSSLGVRAAEDGWAFG